MPYVEHHVPPHTYLCTFTRIIGVTFTVVGPQNREGYSGPSCRTCRDFTFNCRISKTGYKITITRQMLIQMCVFE